MKKLIGYLLISSPFVGVFIFAVKTCGWKDTLITFGLVCAVALIMYIGVTLTTSKK